MSYTSIAYLHHAFAFPFPLAPPPNHPSNPLLAALISRNPGLSSSAAYGFPPPTPTSVIALASLLFSICPAQTRHCMGFSSALLITAPAHSRKTEKSVSSVMSSGRLTFGSREVGRKALGAAGREEEGSRECS